MIYSIIIESNTPHTQQEWTPVCQIVDTFLDAIRFGFFGHVLIEVKANPEYKSRLFIQSFEAELLNQSYFLVLAGMLSAWKNNSDNLILSLNITVDHQHAAISELSLSQLTVPTKRQVSFVKPDVFDLHDSFVLFISFAIILNKSQQDFLRRALEIWEHLLIGGLPENGFKLGESMIGQTKGYFSEPKIYHYAVEGIAANPICLDLIINFLEANQDKLPVQLIEIQ